MDLKLAGQVAVVTGGASGIGAATVQMLLDEGVKVAAWDLRCSSPPVDQTNHLKLTADVSSLEAISAAWTETEKRLGPITILVHAAAAGSGHFGFPYTNVPLSAWSEVFRINVLGMATVAQVAGPAMKAHRTGSMVFLSSVAGQIGSQTDPPYSASKAANINFAQCMAKDLAGFGVRVNSVCPGMVRTPLNEAVWRSWNEQQPEASQRTYDEWAAEKISKVIPLQRWQTPEDIAAMIVFLCSPRASEITGQTINVDGGCVMHW
jgi:2-hydroxycyclohexanecarboxyl-CoA dehydrogenase